MKKENKKRMHLCSLTPNFDIILHQLKLKKPTNINLGRAPARFRVKGQEFVISFSLIF